MQSAQPLIVNSNMLVVDGKNYTIYHNRVYMPFDKISSYPADELPAGLNIAFTNNIESDAGNCENTEIRYENGIVVSFSVTIDRRKRQHGMPGGSWGHIVAAVAETDPACIEQFFFSVQDVTLHMVMRFQGGTVAEIINMVLAKLTKIVESAKAVGLTLVTEAQKLNLNRSVQ